MKENHYNCIYMYINKVNGKRYVGQAVDFNRRHKSHILKSSNKYPIDKALNKYGIENFEIKILAENIPTQEKMNEYEKFFIKRFNSLIKNGMGYNLASGGNNGNPLAGKTEEEIKEIRRKQSESNKGENNSMYGKTCKNNPFYGKHHTEETKQKMREIHKGKKIAQYDKENNLIKVWRSTMDIQYELGINNSNIIKCCKFWEINCDKEEWFKNHKGSPIKSTGGFIWKYID